MPRYSDESLFELAREAFAELGPGMNQSDFGRHSGYSSVLIPKRFGSWGRFRELAGLPPQPKGNPKLRQSTREGLIATLLEVVAARGYSFRMRDFCAWSGVTTTSIYSHFGSWKDYWTAAGLLPPLRTREHKYSGERLVERVREVVRELGPQMTLTDFCRRTGIPFQPIYYYHGSWPKLRERAGLPRQRPPAPPLSDDELMQNLHSVATWHWRFPRLAEYVRRGEYSAATFHRRYGAWKEVEQRYRSWLYQSFPAISGVVPAPADFAKKSTQELLRLLKGRWEFARR